MEQWSNLQTESGVYMMRLNKQSGEYTMWLSDLKILWKETVTGPDLFERFANKNPEKLAMDDDVIKNELISALCTVANVKYSNVRNKSHNDDDVELQLKYLIFDEKEVEIQWLLKKCGPQEFFDQITKLAFRQIGELQDQKEQLVDIAKKKDDEIDQYKLELGQVSIRKRFVTNKFEEQMFASRTQMFKCKIDRFESVIGLLPKNVASNESNPKDESCNATEQSNQNTSVVKHKSPKGKRNQRRPFYAKVVRPKDIKFGEDDGDDDDDDNGSNSAMEKRTRQSF